MSGEVTLAPGESLPTPILYAAWSNAGLAGLSRAFHAYARRHLLRLAGPRPVTLNTWEGTYFDHDEARLMREATAAALGIERFVLDDGWMPGRDHERAGLGDWTADPRKYPNGFGPLARHVTGLGMQFGLWVEPGDGQPRQRRAARAPGRGAGAGRPVVSLAAAPTRA
jgi:alpha-galactosidase